MQALFSAVYLLTCVALATVVTEWVMARSIDEDYLSRFLAWLVIFFATFFCGFYLLGYINLATDLPVVNPVYGSVLLLLALAGFGLRFAKRIPSLLKPVGNIDLLRNPALRISLPGTGISRVLLIVTLVTFIFIALMLMVGFPRGYEAQGYHLPIGLHIFQAQSLQIWDTVSFHAVPVNASIYFGFLLGLMSEHLVAAAGLVFLIPLVVAVYGVGRATGADETASLLASLGLLTIPIIAFSAFEATADVGAATFLAMAVYFAIARSSRVPSHRVLCGLAAGLAFGFKNFYLVSFTYLFLLILFQAWGDARKDALLGRIWSTARPALTFLVSVLAVSGFWLVRNYVQLGNPIYPVYIPIFDIFGWAKASDFAFTHYTDVQFKWVRSSIEWFVYPWVEWHDSGQNFMHSSGLGAFFAATVPVACLSSLIGVIRRERKEWPVIASLLGGGTLMLLVWSSLLRQPRYFMGAFVFLVPLVAWTISLAMGRSRKVFELIAALCILCMLAVIFSKQLIEFGTRFVYSRQFTREEFYGYPAMVDRLPPGSTIINLGHRTSNYFLYGKSYQNRIVNYVRAHQALKIQMLQDDGPAESAYLAFSTLRELDATYVFTEGSTRLSHDGCVHLQDLDRLDKDLFGNPLPKPRRIYEINYCDLETNNDK